MYTSIIHSRCHISGIEDFPVFIIFPQLECPFKVKLVHIRSILWDPHQIIDWIIVKCGSQSGLYPVLCGEPSLTCCTAYRQHDTTVQQLGQIGHHVTVLCHHVTTNHTEWCWRIRSYYQPFVLFVLSCNEWPGRGIQTIQWYPRWELPVARSDKHLRTICWQYGQRNCLQIRKSPSKCCLG